MRLKNASRRRRDAGIKLKFRSSSFILIPGTADANADDVENVIILKSTNEREFSHYDQNRSAHNSEQNFRREKMSDVELCFESQPHGEGKRHNKCVRGVEISARKAGKSNSISSPHFHHLSGGV